MRGDFRVYEEKLPILHEFILKKKGINNERKNDIEMHESDNNIIFILVIYIYIYIILVIYIYIYIYILSLISLILVLCIFL